MAIPIDYFKHDKDIKTFQPGDMIFEAGTTGTVMYAIRSGEVEIYFGDLLVETVGALGFVGEKALISPQTPHTTSAYAKDEVQAVEVDEKEFLFLVHETPTFALHMMRVLAERARQAMRVVLS